MMAGADSSWNKSRQFANVKAIIQGLSDWINRAVSETPLGYLESSRQFGNDI